MEISYLFYAHNTRKSCAVGMLNAILRSHLKDVRPIATAHCHCGRKLTRHVMHWARALSSKIKNKMIGKMAITTASCVDLTISDIRWSLHFFQETDFIYNYLHIIQTRTKTESGKLKNFQDFCPRDIESCHLATARCVKLWSLILNLFFKEPKSIQLSRNLLNRPT